MRDYLGTGMRIISCHHNDPARVLTDIYYKDADHFYVITISDSTGNWDDLVGELIPLHLDLSPLPKHILNPLVVAPNQQPWRCTIKYVDYRTRATHPWDPGMPPPKNRHIQEYYGAVLDSERKVQGLCFKSYGVTLREAVQWSLPKVDLEQILRDCKSALMHLHERGFVHNNVSLDTIVLDEDRRGVLVNFTNCRWEREPVPANHPSIDPNSSPSAAKDLNNLERCRAWVLANS